MQVRQIERSLSPAEARWHALCLFGHNKHISPPPQQDPAMFSVESLIHEDEMASTMGAMRAWLDQEQFEPTAFRYTFTATGGVVCRIDFLAESEAAGFAKAFNARVIDAVVLARDGLL
jgi:hypothetical protein